MKKTIQLKESDITRMVMEAVNELDPRTYASYAKKRAEQGQMDKANIGRDAAVKAWNKQFGEDGENMYSGYQVLQNNWSKDGLGKKINNQKQYNPYMGVSSDSQITYFRDGSKEETPPRTSIGYYGTNYKGASVAQQMANGTGQYVKNKGWQNESIVREAVNRTIRKYIK